MSGLTKIKKAMVMFPIKKESATGDLSNKKDFEFVFPGGYSEERTKEEIQKQDKPLNKFGKAQTDNPKVIEQFEHDCSLNQDHKKNKSNPVKKNNI